MDSDILTLSLCDWLGLPIFDFNEWKKGRKREESPNVPAFYPPKEFAELRAVAGDVAEYYEEYVNHMGLSGNFKNDVAVEQVDINHKSNPANNCRQKSCYRPTESCKKEWFPEDRGVVCPVIDKCHRWVVRGSSKRTAGCNNDTGNELVIEAKNLVLAGGLSRPMSIGVPGEQLDYIIDGSTFRQKIPQLKLHQQSQVLIVGAGMSGADIALLCLREGIKCIHAFKQKPDDPGLMMAKMLPGIYEEYHHLSLLMKGLKASPLYTPLSQHMVMEFRPNGECVLMNLRDNSTVTLQGITYVVEMVGYCANLDFLPDDVKTYIITNPSKPVHCKHNPLDVDLYSFRNEVYPNLYALGPLTGDNFVRFVFGSGLGCAQSILNQH